MQSCGMSLVKYLLFGFNILFCITGIILVAIGGVVLSESTYSADYNQNATYIPSIILIVLGIVIFGIAFLGCFGAIRESYCMLISFAVFLLIIFITELAIGIAAAVNKDELNLNDFKNSFNTGNEKDKANWDAIQKGFKCCGVDGPSDWGGSIPESCCLASSDTGDEPYAACQAFGKSMDYLAVTGCFERIRYNFNTGKKVLTGVGIGIAFVEVLGIVLACWLASVIKREKAEEGD